MASETLAKLVVKMEADSARLQKDLDQAKGRINNFERSAKDSFSSLGGAIKNTVAALATIGTVRAFGHLVAETAAAGAEIDKLSKRLGVSTEFISRMKFGAETTGATFEDLRSGLEKLEKSTAKGEEGLKKTTEAFNALGINVERFAQLNAEQRFEVVAEAIKRAGASAAASNASFLLLGSSAGKLDELMRGGAEGIRLVGDAADKAGVTLDQQMTQKLKEADDAVDNLDQQLKVLKINMTTMIGVPIVSWVNDLTDALGKGWMAAKQLSKEGIFNNKTIDELVKSYQSSFEGGAKPLSQFLFSDVGEGKGNKGALAAIRTTAEIDATAYFNEFMDTWEKSKTRLKSPASLKKDSGDHGTSEGNEFVGPSENLLSTANALYQESQNEKLAIQRDALDAEFAAAIEMEDKLGQVWKQSADERRSSVLSSTSSMLGSLAIIADGHNKKAFNNSKKLAIAQATVDAIAAAIAAGKSAASLGPAAAFAAYGAVALNFAARIKQINSTSYGGGGSVGGGTGGGTSTIPNGVPTGPIQGQQTAQQVLQIQFTGNVYGLKDFEDRVVEAVKNASDKDVVIISNNTAQAREIMRA